MNKQDIADRYAKSNKFDTAELVAVKDRMAYYRLDWESRPRYTGHPCVIKISPSGKVQPVTDRDEIYWAIQQPKPVCNSPE